MTVSTIRASSSSRSAARRTPALTASRMSARVTAVSRARRLGRCERQGSRRRITRPVQSPQFSRPEPTLSDNNCSTPSERSLRQKGGSPDATHTRTWCRSAADRRVRADLTAPCPETARTPSDSRRTRSPCRVGGRATRRAAPVASPGRTQVFRALTVVALTGAAVALPGDQRAGGAERSRPDDVRADPHAVHHQRAGGREGRRAAQRREDRPYEGREGARPPPPRRPARPPRRTARRPATSSGSSPAS